MTRTAFLRVFLDLIWILKSALMNVVWALCRACPKFGKGFLDSVHAENIKERIKSGEVSFIISHTDTLIRILEKI